MHRSGWYEEAQQPQTTGTCGWDVLEWPHQLYTGLKQRARGPSLLYAPSYVYAAQNRALGLSLCLVVKRLYLLGLIDI